jgi:hypothetical protein
MKATQKNKEKHLNEIEEVFLCLFDKFKLKTGSKSHLKYIFRLIGCKNINQAVFRYRKNLSINKKVLAKLEILKRLINLDSQ